ncbi:hypothetical protein CDAR_404921 [Caerostris darwini]|uniref:Uncharacterized protein n=1 Tax=Caerostris darwini TaxID=1538125 RepID=A0AAV4U6S6_9ARAC|nr:hypothetical protein CDAR_404921 [Caerostris darwini]
MLIPPTQILHPHSLFLSHKTSAGHRLAFNHNASRLMHLGQFTPINKYRPMSTSKRIKYAITEIPYNKLPFPSAMQSLTPCTSPFRNAANYKSSKAAIFGKRTSFICARKIATTGNGPLVFLPPSIPWGRGSSHTHTFHTHTHIFIL